MLGLASLRGWALTSACALLVALAGCGGGDSGESTPQRARGHIGQSRVATSQPHGERPPGERRGGVAQREPSVADLDRSNPREALKADGKACTGGGLHVRRESLSMVGRATLCLLNTERRARGLRRLRLNPRLARAALGHSKDMVRRSYFAHDSRSGATFMDRIRRRGYLSGASRWTVGENIAWGAGTEGTPRSIVEAWMKSPPHRANILSRTYSEVGIGVALGTPAGESSRPGATYNTDFGMARGRKR